MNERTWLDDKGRPLPLEECTKEQLIARFRYVVGRSGERLNDRIAAHEGAIKALETRCKDLRKAKRLANARADKAVAAMKLLLDTLGTPDA